MEKGQQGIPGVFPLCRWVFEQALRVAAAEFGERVLGVGPWNGQSGQGTNREETNVTRDQHTKCFRVVYHWKQAGTR